MILTCPSCGTQYVVKDGAIPPQGRQVRCASCKHSWHQDPEPAQAVEPEEESVAEAAMIDQSTGPEAEERAYEEAALAAEVPIEGTAAEEPAGKDLAGDDEAPVEDIGDAPAPVDPVAPPAEALIEANPAASILPVEHAVERHELEPAAD